MSADGRVAATTESGREAGACGASAEGSGSDDWRSGHDEGAGDIGNAGRARDEGDGSGLGCHGHGLGGDGHGLRGRWAWLRGCDWGHSGHDAEGVCLGEIGCERVGLEQERGDVSDGF